MVGDPMLRRALILSPLLALACATPPAAAPPDAAVTACEVRFVEAAGLVLGPSDTRALVAQVTPAQATPVRIGLLGGALDATLDRSAAASSADGAVRFQLTAPTSAASFQVRVAADCGGEALLGVTVDARGTGVLDANAIYRGNRGPSGITVDLLRADDCAALVTSTVERTATLPAPGGAAQFSGLLEGVDYTLRATATGVGRAVLADACAGPFRVLAGERRGVDLRFTDRPASLATAYELALVFDLGDAAARSSAQWMETSRAAIRAAGGEARLFVPELADAVAQSVPRELSAAARSALTTALEGELGAEVEAALTQRGARVDASLLRLAEQTAAGVARVRLRGTLTAPAVEGGDWRAERIEAVLDPGTPEVAVDDVVVPLDETAAARLSRSGAETVVGSLSALPLPYARVARRTLSAVVQRFGAASTGELIALAACPVIAAMVTPVSALCDERCVLAACRQSADRVGRTFDDAVARADAARATVDQRFAAAGRVAPGTLRITRVEALTAGGFREEPGLTVVASATLTAGP
jgi:hypothetical protein